MAEKFTPMKTKGATDVFEVPEGGWGWLIVIAVALGKMSFWGTLPCFGIVFADVLEMDPEIEGAAVTSTTGAFSLCVAIIGIFCPALYQAGLSIQLVGVSGGIINFIGFFSSIFITSVGQLVLTVGIIQGFGFGLMMSAALAAFNLYFRRRRTIAMALALALCGAGALTLPLLVQAVYSAHGPRAARATIAGVSLMAAISQWLLRDPSSKAQAPKFTGGDIEEPCGTPFKDEKIVRDVMEHKKNEIRNEKNVEENELETLTNNNIIEGKIGRTKWLKPKLDRLWILSGLDSSLLRDSHVAAVIGCLALVHIADSNFFALLPLHLRALRMRSTQVARIVTVACAGDLAGRVTLAIIGLFLANRNRITFALGVSLSAAAIVVFSFVKSLEAITCLAVLLGICKGLIYTTYYLTIAEIVPAEKFPAAIAFYFAGLTFISIVVSPAIGLVRDLTRSFPVCFWALAGLLAVCPVIWGPQMMIRKFSRRYNSPSRDEESPALT